jgi:flagellar operon protein
MGYRVINGKLHAIGNFPEPNVSQSKKSTSNVNFQDVLKNEIDKKESFVISNHAAERLNDRNITLNESDMNKINDGINKANDKGAKECLILYKDLALITNIKNRTVITAVDKSSSKENVFTNIDSVVLL